MKLHPYSVVLLPIPRPGTDSLPLELNRETYAILETHLEKRYLWEQLFDQKAGRCHADRSHPSGPKRYPTRWVLGRPS